MKEERSAVYSYQRCVFIAAVFQSPKPFQRQKVSAAECHNRNGAPRSPVFWGLQTKNRDTIERLVNQQCTNTNANIIVSSAATMSKGQPPEHILLPEHSSHAKFRAMVSASLFGWGANARSKQPAKINTHSVQIGFVNLSVASGETCNGSNNFVKKVEAFPQGHGLVAKNVSVCKTQFLMQPASDIQDPVCACSAMLGAAQPNPSVMKGRS